MILQNAIHLPPPFVADKVLVTEFLLQQPDLIPELEVAVGDIEAQQGAAQHH